MDRDNIPGVIYVIPPESNRGARVNNNDKVAAASMISWFSIARIEFLVKHAYLYQD